MPSRTPREIFLTSGHVAKFKAAAETEAFEFGCAIALLQLSLELPGNTHPGLPTDPYVGIDANAQMHGARRVLDILKTLHEPIKPPTAPKIPTLNY